MATLSDDDSRRMYSWWWDSHISPKNSKWLQDNLTDIDAKVKTMIKLIEEDADSFAKRAEMYYEKRPELMKLVEEFYRAYRALAERYDHATGALRQAHRSMAEAFPNQVPLVMAEDSPPSSEVSTPVRALFEPTDLHKDLLVLFKKNGALTQESDSLTSRKGLNQHNGFGSGGHSRFSERKARRGLNFDKPVENESHAQSNEILILKEALAKLEAEKEAGLVHYQQSLDRFSKLESEFSRAQEESRELTERTSKAEAESQSLREAICRFEVEKEASLLQYQQCSDKIYNLQNNLSDAQKETEELNKRASKAEAERDAAFDQYKKSMDMISDLENKLHHAEEEARRFRESAEKAESEVETLKQAITKLTEEKEAAFLRYQKCLESISSLERNVSFAQKEDQRLNGEIDNGVAKLKAAEEQCLQLERSNKSLHSELESLVMKSGTQSQALTEKQKELGRLWGCIQEERFRYLEAETAFQTLQNLHSLAQDELRSMVSELQNKAQISRDVETRNQNLHNELLKLEEGNKSLNELNLSSAFSMKNMQNEIFSLTETNVKLEEEVELRLNQRNALQKEIYCLKEEVNESNKIHRAIFESSLKELEDENLNLKQNCQSERSEKVALLEKLVIMEQLLDKNAVLENSLSDLGSELEGVRGKIKALEEACQSLLEENSTLVDEKASLLTQLEVTTDNLEEISEKNTVLENCLTNAHDELEVLKAKSKSLEDSCQLLVNQNAGLLSEKDALISHNEITHLRLEDLEKRFTELEEKYMALEKEKETTLCKVEELKVSLEGQKQEHVGFSQMSESRLSGMEIQIHLLHEENRHKHKELVEELEKALDSQIEIFVLRKCVQELEEKNFALLTECQKLMEASELSEKLISELEMENLEQQLEVERYRAVEEENFSLFGEILSLTNFSLIFKNTVYEKSVSLQEELSGMERKFEEVQMENRNLKGALQKSENELITVTFVSDQLNYEVVKGRNLLKHKEMELLAAQWKVSTTENANSELHTVVDDLKSKYDGVGLISREQMNQIFRLSEDNDRLTKENGFLLEAKKRVEVELLQLHKEHEETKNILKERVKVLECENGELKAQLDPYGPSIISLRDSILSLENFMHSNLRKFSSVEGKDDELENHPHAKSHQSKYQNALFAPDAFSGLQDLQTRVKEIERTLIEKERLAQENLIPHAKQEDSARKTGEFTSQRENAKATSEISTMESRCLTKDIVLDQTSECDSHGISSRQFDSHMVELWETIDHDSSIDLTVGRSKKLAGAPMGKDIEYRQLVSVKRKSKFSGEELSVDQLELSKKFAENRREGSKRKILERLNSDVQKLTNLQITVQDLKNKVKIIENSKKVKAIVEYDSLKGQLEEAEAAIQMLFDLNGKLVNNIEDRALSDKKSAKEESGNIRRRRISEQARRASEKIGRLQLEVQKIQFLLVKLDDEKESKGRGIVLDTKRRVLLRDYIYGGVKKSPRRKKAPFCGCIQPPTRG
ncbi:hypothetical protein LguiB_030624 [Lonicera macranthoides]